MVNYETIQVLEKSENELMELIKFAFGSFSKDSESTVQSLVNLDRRSIKLCNLIRNDVLKAWTEKN